MSSVDDPEKHFLGNLLEDDPGPSSAAGSVSGRNESTPLGLTLSQLPNVGPVMRPVSDLSMSNAWPEPPPPYSPPLDSWALPSNANTTLTSSTTTTPTNANWYPFTERKETELLTSFNIGGNSSPVTPSTPNRVSLPPSPQIHHIHHNLHHHTHTHNVQVQNHYFGAPPPGLESFGPRATTATASSSPPVQNNVNPVPLYDAMTSPVWSYNGIANIKTNTTSLLFSDWKKENMSQASAEPTIASDSSTSLKSIGLEEAEAETLQMPLSPAKVVEVAKEKKNVSKSYAEHLSKSSAATPKKGTPIGAEKKQKQELAKKMSSQTLGENSAARILVKGQPHSAPVVTKMPFSYRDVAARVEHSSSSNHAIHQNDERKGTTAAEAKPSDAKAVQSKQSELLNDISKEQNESRKSESGRKSRADNEFQKIINRKNKKEKNSNAVVAPVVYESVHPVDASSRYDVLKNLESLPAQQRKKNVSGRPPLIQEIFSRSSSPADDLEDTEGEETHRNRSASNHAHLNGNNQMKKEQKKRVVQTSQRRRKARKTEPTMFDNFLTYTLDLLVFFWSCIVGMFQWTFELIVEVCVKIYDVFLYSSEWLYMGAWKALRRVFMFLIALCIYICILLRYLAFFFTSGAFGRWYGTEEKAKEEEVKELEWGCKKEIPIPTNATEYADRLSRETVRDAYTVLGLKSDCSDDDIKRNYKRLSALVSPDKCGIEAVEDVYALVNAAFEAIGYQEPRAVYTVENMKENGLHAALIDKWNLMSNNIEKARNTIYCDCSKPHMRIATEISPAQARYCKRCSATHPAKQNDIWIVKKNLGLTTAYFTCTDNVVYDITEWAICEKNKNELHLSDTNCRKTKDLQHKRKSRGD
ncbi:unnamed protein product [Caenorhabditis sp. 36 PRJEB53466]|nr:unnamed protein product [Caenorhabditis sp. 36 PRJEB53466]